MYSNALSFSIIFRKSNIYFVGGLLIVCSVCVVAEFNALLTNWMIASLCIVFMYIDTKSSVTNIAFLEL